MVNHRILELFSGIGGMHYAWRESGLEGHIVAAVDINTLANRVYSHNFKEITVMNRNIQSLTSDFINSMRPDVILMSPPCQPFTRNGLKKDSDDVRSFSFSHLLSILEGLSTVEYILLENVKGFEDSNMRDMLVDSLKQSNFLFQEFLLSPSQFGIPNSRLRYYCLAKRKPFQMFTEEKIITKFPDFEGHELFPVSNITEDQPDNSYILCNKFIKRASILDICYPDSKRSCCFTKAYTHFLEGTGSVYTESTKEDVEVAFEKCKNYAKDSEEYIEIISKLKLRFFTPKEVSRLMAFPDSFTFPADVTKKQCHRLLGNSINVKVVSELIKYLIDS